MGEWPAPDPERSWDALPLFHVGGVEGPVSHRSAPLNPVPLSAVPLDTEVGSSQNPGPADAVVWVDRLTEGLERMRAQAPDRLTMPTPRLIEGLADWTGAWCSPEYPWRRALVAHLPPRMGVSASMLERALTDLFSVWRADAMHALVALELERPTQAAGMEGEARRWAPVALTSVFLAGNSLGPTLQSLLACLLARSPVVLKAPGGDPWFAYVLIQSLVQTMPRLAPCVGYARWSGEDPLSDVLLSQSEQALVFGRAESILALRRRAPAWVRLHERGPRVSLAYVDASSADHPETVRGLAEDIVLYERQGCLSPVVVLYEGDIHGARRFAQRLAQEGLGPLAQRWPMVGEAPARAAERMQWLGVQSFLGEVFEGGGGAVVLDGASELCLPPPGRVVWIKCVSGVSEIRAYLAPVRRVLQAAALAVSPERWEGAVEALRHVGFTRCTRVGRLQRPPLSWTADGMPVLIPLVRWISLDI